MNSDKIRSILNIIFMILVLVAVILYFTGKNGNSLFVYLCGGAIVIKFLELFLRSIKRSGKQ